MKFDYLLAEQGGEKEKRKGKKRMKRMMRRSETGDEGMGT